MKASVGVKYKALLDRSIQCPTGVMTAVSIDFHTAVSTVHLECYRCTVHGFLTFCYAVLCCVDICFLYYIILSDVDVS
jgi:hypothetical protein